MTREMTRSLADYCFCESCKSEVQDRPATEPQHNLLPEEVQAMKDLLSRAPIKTHAGNAEEVCEEKEQAL